MITPDQVAELRARSTPGEWYCGYKYVSAKIRMELYHNIAQFPGVGVAPENHQWIKDAELIASLPEICDLVAAQAAELAASRAERERFKLSIEVLKGTRLSCIECPHKEKANG